MSRYSTVKAALASTPPCMLSEKTVYELSDQHGISPKCISKILSEIGASAKPLSPWGRTAHGKLVAIERFNARFGTSFTSIAEIYAALPASNALGAVTRFTSTTILRWLKDEGGIPKPRGGDNRGNIQRTA